MTLSIHHIALNVGAFDPALDYLTEGAGLKRVAGAPGVEAWLAGPNAYVWLRAADAPPSAADLGRQVSEQGITHFCLQAQDSDALLARLKAAGGRFHAAPVSLGTGVLYSYAADAEANVIEVEGVSEGADGVAAWIAHVALASPDLSRLSDFYAGLIGRPSHRNIHLANPLFDRITGLKDVEVKASWIMADNLIFEMWQYVNPPTVARAPRTGLAPGYAHVGFLAEELAVETARLRAAGIELAPAEPIAGQACVAGRDPDGNRFLILQAPPSGTPLSLQALDAPTLVSDRLKPLLDRDAAQSAGSTR